MRSRVLWVVVDSLGVDQVNAGEMGWLCGLATQGGMAAEGGEAVMPALTYPNHASFVTGALPEVHGITGNQVFSEGEWSSAESVGPSAETVFDVLAAAGLRSVAVFGDQNLVGVCGAMAATAHWPEGGVHGPGTMLAGTGYAADSQVLAAARGLGLATYDLAFVQLDEMDSVCHIHGPRSEEATTASAAVDQTLEALASAYSDCWDETLVVVVSDHEQEPVDVDPVAFDNVIAAALGTAAPANPYAGDPGGRWRTDGTVAWVSPETLAALGGIGDLDGVEGARVLADGSAVAWGHDGVLLGLDWGQRGDHGSSRTARQVAVVGGGHPAARRIGELITRTRPHATDWNEMMTTVLLGQDPHVTEGTARRSEVGPQ